MLVTIRAPGIMSQFAAQETFEFAITFTKNGMQTRAVVVVVTTRVFSTTFEASDLISWDFAFQPIGAMAHLPAAATL